MNTDNSPEKPPIDAHPAYQFGAFLSGWFLRYERQLANFLNRGQRRVGLRVRNCLLGLMGLLFLLYFISLLFQ